MTERKRSAVVKLPSAEEVQAAMSEVRSTDDFFGKDGMFARLFRDTIQDLLEVELTEHLGYPPHAVEGHHSGNSRNGYSKKRLRSSAGDVTISVPRDRKGDFQPAIVPKYQTTTGELESKVVALYAKGMSLPDIALHLEDAYGVEIAPQTLSAMTDKILPRVAEWQNRPLAEVYAVVFLDALHVKIRQNGKVLSTAVYIAFGIDLDGSREVLGHWVGDGAEGANYWMGILSDIQQRGVKDIFIACVDGLTGFPEAIRAIFPASDVQCCIVHQIRNCLRYVASKHQKAFMADLKAIYRAPTREAAELALDHLEQAWAPICPVAVRSWRVHWDTLSTYFDYPAEIRRLIYTTNRIEGYNRQLRRVIKTKGAFPTPDAARKLLYLAHQDITRKWTGPIYEWSKILNQLAIRFEHRIPA
jgi:putative transposase